MTGDIKLGKLSGIPFRLHWSWFIALFLIVWTLSLGFFPQTLPQYHDSPGVYWLLGVAAALGLFISVILHEMGHAVVARGYGVEVRSIRLFVFGGIAELSSDPKKPKHEILIAIAGPAVTFLLIILFQIGFSAIVSLSGIGWQVVDGELRLHGGSVFAVGSAALLAYLGMINAFVLIFNLIPAFPLDGGRVLRGIIWAINRNYLTATRIAAMVGIGFAYLLFIGGFFVLIHGSIVGGVWLFFLGMFLQGAAQSSVAYAQLHQLLRGVKVSDIMSRHPITIEAWQTLREAVDEYFLRFPYKAYPVVAGGRVLGILSLQAVQAVDRDEWDHVHTGDLVIRQKPLPVLAPNDSALLAFRTIAQSDSGRLAVMDNGTLTGVLSARDIMDYVEIHSGLNPTSKDGGRHLSDELDEDSLAHSSRRE